MRGSGWVLAAVLAAGPVAAEETALPPGMQAVRIAANATLPGAPPAPEAPGLPPVLLHVPEGYGKVPEPFRGHDLPLYRWQAVLPSFGPAAPAPERCGKPQCGDEVGGVVQVAPGLPQRSVTGSVKSEVEASEEVTKGRMTVEALPPPPGYEEALKLFRKPVSPARAYTGVNLELLVYRDADGRRQLGQCRPGEQVPTCAFRTFEPAAHLLITYDFPMAMLAQRAEIEAGVRKLVMGWVATP